MALSFQEFKGLSRPGGVSIKQRGWWANSARLACESYPHIQTDE